MLAPRLLTTAFLFPLLVSASVHAASLQSSDGTFQNAFGFSVAIDGSTVVVGAPWAPSGGSYRGAGYLYRNINTATGTVEESAKLLAGDRANNDELGTAVAISGDLALAGAAYDRATYREQGSAYLYRNISGVNGSVTQTLKLQASDPTASAYFGSTISMHGTSALIAATGANVGENENQGAVYLYRNLDTRTSTVQDAKLISSDGDWYDWFGTSVSIHGSIGIVTAYNTTAGGSAYLYHDLDTATGTIEESAKFQNSRNAGFDGVSALHGTSAIIGGGQDIFLYRNLDNVSGAQQEVAILTPSGPMEYGANALAYNGSAALAGYQYENRGGKVDVGVVHLYTGLDALTGNRSEDIQIVSSDASGNDRFGVSVALSGDQFVIGADGADGKVGYSGKAYVGSISSLTTLDVGDAARSISKISFSSRLDWVIGSTTSRNTITLGAGDTAELLLPEKAVYIGQNAGSNGNLLSIAGHLAASEVYIGAVGGNTGNIFRLEATGTFALESFRLTAGNTLSFHGNYTDINTLLTFLGDTDLFLWSGEAWEAITAETYADLVTLRLRSGYTEIAAVPEPSMWFAMAAFTLSFALGSAARKRRAMAA